MRAEGAETGRFCGRSFSRQEVQWIKGLLAVESLSRQELSRRVCRHLGWVNHAGRLKEMSCRVALLRMDRAGLIGLPARHVQIANLFFDSEAHYVGVVHHPLAVVALGPKYLVDGVADTTRN